MQIAASAVKWTAAAENCDWSATGDSDVEPVNAFQSFQQEANQMMMMMKHGQK